MNTYALPALKEKRAVIDGRIISLKKQIARHQKELVSIDTTIALFDATYRIVPAHIFQPPKAVACVRIDPVTSTMNHLHISCGECLTGGQTVGGCVYSQEGRTRRNTA
jgi:hypothetical protein